MALGMARTPKILWYSACAFVYAPLSWGLPSSAPPVHRMCPPRDGVDSRKHLDVSVWVDGLPDGLPMHHHCVSLEGDDAPWKQSATEHKVTSPRHGLLGVMYIRSPLI
ncbi:hypothetical protein DMENIID0001_018330 [Sergentomyia squamirostris]